MEVDHIFPEWIIRRQVGSAPEPFLRALGEVAKVCVHGRHERVAGMKNQGNSGCGECTSFTGNLSSELRGHLSMDFREVHAGFFEDRAIRDDARATSSPTFALPSVFLKDVSTAILAQRRANAVLQVPEILGRLASAVLFLGHWYVPIS